MYVKIVLFEADKAIFVLLLRQDITFFIDGINALGGPNSLAVAINLLTGEDQLTRY